MKTWDTPGFSPYFTQWKPDFTGFVPGTNPVCPRDNPGDEGRHRKFMWKQFMCLFRSLENLLCGFPSIPGIAPGVAPRIVVFVLLKSWDAIPRMEFRTPRKHEFRIPRAALRIPRRMAFQL